MSQRMTPEQKRNSERGLRFNQDKLKWSLVDFSALEPMVKTLMFGANKYAPNNWKKGISITETIESLLRHTIAYLHGEDVDPESGISHIGHMQCNTLFLGYMERYRPDMDDRFKDPNKIKKNEKHRK